MKSVVIYTPYECLIKNDNSQQTLDINQHITLENYSSIYVYPIGKTKRYSFVIDVNDKNNQFYSIVEKNDKYLIFLIDGLYSQNVDIYSFQFNNEKSFTEVSSQSIKFKTKSHIKKIYLPFSFKKIKCGNFYFINYVLLENNNFNILIAYNTKSNVAKQFHGEKIEVYDKGFKVINSQNFYDSIEKEYYVDSEGLKLKNKAFVLSDQNYPCELLPYQFMYALKNDDDNIIKNLLSESITSKLSLEDIKNYFGSIDYFYMIDYKTCFALSNKGKIIYEFCVENSKIVEINDNTN